jgi:hypothetical protein
VSGWQKSMPREAVAIALLRDIRPVLSAWALGIVEIIDKDDRNPLDLRPPHHNPLPPPAQHPWTRSTCLQLLVSVAGGTGPARAYGAASLCARVRRRLPHNSERYDHTSGKCVWLGQG